MSTDEDSAGALNHLVADGVIVVHASRTHVQIVCRSSACERLDVMRVYPDGESITLDPEQALDLARKLERWGSNPTNTVSTKP